MKSILPLPVFLATAFLATIPAIGSDAPSTARPLKCDIGPLNKVFGQTEWLVYGCDDESTLIVVSAPGSPAAPFYFMLQLNDGGYRISGEGTGSKAATDAAFVDLQALSVQEIAELFEQTHLR